MRLFLGHPALPFESRSENQTSLTSDRMGWPGDRILGRRRGGAVFRQYYAPRFRSMYPPIATKVGRKTIYHADPRDKHIGTIPVGTILYIQDGVNPLRGFTRPFIRREPWIVEGWLPREYAKWDGQLRTFKSVYIRGGHLAVVRSLRNRNRVTTVADWILLASVDAGLERFSCA